MPEAAPATTVRIRALLPSLAPAERRVAECVLTDPAAVAASTIGLLARQCATSETTVIRFCRAVGFTGYPALRLSLAAEAGRHQAGNGHDATGDIAADDDLDKVVATIAFADARAVEDTADQLDLGTLHAVVDAIVEARRVDVYGVGASGFVALDFQQKLHRIGRVAFAWNDTHVALTSAALLTGSDVAVAISHSGATADTLDALALARRRGAVTVAVTNFPRSPLARLADHLLTTAARETTFRSGATASRLAQLTVVDCVFVGVAQRTYETSQRALDLTHEAVRDRRVGHKTAR
ncbi:MurR/RpiR family transcriptional regulator [Nocardioides sp. CER19]|uniref:MurR/RpiR family transcriptional regulator n=1 Tax=Nocardioides sp. CER19 TaxID=3038538 RepID=UPI0024468A95|nr:MurR/RpiR family transcriptional regulator [Nocardioides sp. CER19]MDH2416188.1 MurR/RpiR family transcriptional regulator [Nocardioides sp. CER19]